MGILNHTEMCTDHSFMVRQGIDPGSEQSDTVGGGRYLPVKFVVYTSTDIQISDRISLPNTTLVLFIARRNAEYSWVPGVLTAEYTQCFESTLGYRLLDIAHPGQMTTLSKCVLRTAWNLLSTAIDVVVDTVYTTLLDDAISC